MFKKQLFSNETNSLIEVCFFKAGLGKSDPVFYYDSSWLLLAETREPITYYLLIATVRANTSVSSYLFL